MSIDQRSNKPTAAL